jgi:hypothetical protein
MKEETDETATTQAPSETEMNGMYDKAWLDFHVDAQEAKQSLDRRYARMVNHFGSYKKMPQEMKDMFKDDYAAHKAKWSENGEEQQKRFGVSEPEAAVKLTGTEQAPTEEQAKTRQEFLQKMQEQRQHQRSRSMEVER